MYIARVSGGVLSLGESLAGSALLLLLLLFVFYPSIHLTLFDAIPSSIVFSIISVKFRLCYLLHCDHDWLDDKELRSWSLDHSFSSLARSTVIRRDGSHAGLGRFVSSSGKVTYLAILSQYALPCLFRGSRCPFDCSEHHRQPSGPEMWSSRCRLREQIRLGNAISVQSSI